MNVGRSSRHPQLVFCPLILDGYHTTLSFLFVGFYPDMCTIMQNGNFVLFRFVEHATRTVFVMDLLEGFTLRLGDDGHVDDRFVDVNAISHHGYYSETADYGPPSAVTGPAGSDDVNGDVNGDDGNGDDVNGDDGNGDDVKGDDGNGDDGNGDDGNGDDGNGDDGNVDKGNVDDGNGDKRDNDGNGDGREEYERDGYEGSDEKDVPPVTDHTYTHLR